MIEMEGERASGKSVLAARHDDDDDDDDMIHRKDSNGCYHTETEWFLCVMAYHVGYLMPKLSLYKNGNSSVYLIAERMRGWILMAMKWYPTLPSSLELEPNSLRCQLCSCKKEYISQRSETTPKFRPKRNHSNHTVELKPIHFEWMLIPLK